MKTFTVPIEPIGKARAKKGRWGFYTPDKTAHAENVIGFYAKAAGVEPIEGPVRLEVFCHFAAPKSWSKKKRKAVFDDGGVRCQTSRPDSDNILKLVADSLSGIAYEDDRQISNATVVKSYDTKNEIIIQVGPVLSQP